MRLKYFIPFIFLGIVGCNTTGESDENTNEEPLVHRFDQEEEPSKKVVEEVGYDPEVVPETSYPSIFEADVSVNGETSTKVKEKKAANVLNIGKEKIKVYDESMGSVNEASLKKLRSQVQ